MNIPYDNENLIKGQKKEINKILRIVSIVTHTDIQSILSGLKHSDVCAKKIFYYIVRTHYPHLINALPVVTECASAHNIYIYAKYIRKEMESDLHINKMVKAIQKKLNITKIKSANAENKEKKIIPPSTTKRLFGFDYTEEEDMMYDIAIHNSAIFWREKMLSVGRKPIVAGMVYSLED